MKRARTSLILGMTSWTLMALVACSSDAGKGARSNGGSGDGTGGGAGDGSGGGSGGLAGTGTGGSITGAAGATGGAPAGGVGGAASGGGGAAGGAGGSPSGGSGGGAPLPADRDGSAGGSPDAGGGATGDAMKGSSPCSGMAAFCDDFEGYPVGAAPNSRWQPATPNTNDGTFTPGGKASPGFSMVVDTTHAYSGTKAFHVAVDYKGNNYASVYMAAKSGITGNTAYGRFMMYQTSWERPHPDTPPGIHARIFFVGNTSVALDFSPTVFVLEADHDGFGADSHMGPKPILNKWICVQAQFAPTLSFTVDGMRVNAPASGGGKGLDQVVLGISSYRVFSTDFWVDDIVVDSKPVDCPKP